MLYPLSYGRVIEHCTGRGPADAVPKASPNQAEPSTTFTSPVTRRIVENPAVAGDQRYLIFAGSGDKATIDRIGERRRRDETGVESDVDPNVDDPESGFRDRLANPALNRLSEEQPSGDVKRGDLEHRDGRDVKRISRCDFREPASGLRPETSGRRRDQPDPDVRVEEHFPTRPARCSRQPGSDRTAGRTSEVCPA